MSARSTTPSRIVAGTSCSIVTSSTGGLVPRTDESDRTLTDRRRPRHTRTGVAAGMRTGDSGRDRHQCGVFDVGMRAHPLVGLDEQYADLLATLDRGEALRRALALLASGSEVAWTAGPGPDGVLTLEQVTGDWTGVLRALRVPPNTGLTGKVFQAGRAEWVDDYFGSQEITHDFDRHMATEKVRRVLAVPLLRDGERLGVLALGPREDGTFGDRDIEHASAVAAQAALAVSIAERARLSR